MPVGFALAVACHVEETAWYRFDGVLTDWSGYAEWAPGAKASHADA